MKKPSKIFHRKSRGLQIRSALEMGGICFCPTMFSTDFVRCGPSMCDFVHVPKFCAPGAAVNARNWPRLGSGSRCRGAIFVHSKQRASAHLAGPQPNKCTYGRTASSRRRAQNVERRHRQRAPKAMNRNKHVRVAPLSRPALAYLALAGRSRAARAQHSRFRRDSAASAAATPQRARSPLGRRAALARRRQRQRCARGPCAA